METNAEKSKERSTEYLAGYIQEIQRVRRNQKEKEKLMKLDSPKSEKKLFSSNRNARTKIGVFRLLTKN